MTKNELIHMANEIFQKSKSQFIQISDDDLCELANAILERAAVECHQGVARMRNDIDGTAFYIATGQCAKAIRSLKLPTN